MDVLFLGTAAAEGWPAPFCACAACTAARRQGGPDVRTRSGVLIDSVVKVDYGPDTVTQMQRERADLTGLTTLVYTHGHDDHFTPAELQYRGPSFVPHALPTLHVFGNTDVISRLEHAYPDTAPLRLRLHPPLAPGRSVRSPDGTEILALDARHAPGALLLRLTRNGKSLLYGHDSGPFPEASVQALAGVPLDLALFDCTYGGSGSPGGGHMGVEGVLDVVARLRAAGTVTDRTRLVATHFSHNGGLLHEALAARFAPHAIQAASDGLRLTV